MVPQASSSGSSSFYVPVDLSRTALLISDVQSQIIARFSPEVQKAYLEQIKGLLAFFRNASSECRNNPTEPSAKNMYQNAPLIIHHVLPFGINQNAFISPYNKLASWAVELEKKGFFSDASKTDPNKPNYAVPAELVPPEGWGHKDEIILPKIQPGSLSSSDLLAYLRARDVKHVVLVGLTTIGSILGGARLAADLDFHVIIPKEGVMDDEPEINDFLLQKVLPRFVDVVGIEDVLALKA
ncbi:Isochorismatase hydrolase [Rhizodiscina lignyota]|uniref:Isochorismatase hydrolase n=1 Tax=Rhizodiscina lignyota TaxID=1504668 RepID=A0A9P4IBI1_9PEZI|nr:Isochorismatase hydrolase [Rhizodiscina lignyota]